MFFLKNQIVNILGFENHGFLLQILTYTTVATQVNGWQSVAVSIKVYLKRGSKQNFEFTPVSKAIYRVGP